MVSKISAIVMGIGAALMIAADAFRAWWKGTHTTREFPKQLSTVPWHWAGALLTFAPSSVTSGALKKFTAQCKACGLSVTELKTQLSTAPTIAVAANFEQLLEQAESGKRTNQLQVPSPPRSADIQCGVSAETCG